MSLDVFLARITKRRTPVALTDSDLSGLHQRSESRTAQRNGHRPRLLSTAAGDVELN